ncbi:MAG TPA: serine/threonine-protein kinase [Gemmataceae bacterium]|nr:serine/threonine-protein kinase [Gemmataceae bacterium]
MARYRPLRFHARGGLGEVYLALDEECHREVALKTIQAEWAGDEASRERFLREAEITARLEHPSIVPVYGMAVGADGRPCYAMRFIGGETLYDAVLRFQAANQAKRDAARGAGPLRQLRARLTAADRAAERALAERQLLAHFIAVCNAVAYAHSRGIIHRDLKPQNVMIGKFGETLVVDWGLARVFTRSPADRATGEDSLVPAGQKAQDLTQSGQVVGTPAYMSPEQAAGRLEALGPASDIYSLGTTLYFLLTGQSPIREPNVQLLLARVQAGDILPPGKVKRSVPPGLDAICRKAMALRPEDRYATAQELAGDVARWLADEPVMGWREPWGERFQRLTRKHAASVAGLGAGLLLMVPLLNIAVQHYTQSFDSLNAMRDTTSAVQAKAQAEIKASQLEGELAKLRSEAEGEKSEAVRKKNEANLIKSRCEARLSGIALAYVLASADLGRPPRRPEELGPFIKADEDRLSPRDGKPFVVAWGVDCNLLAPNQALLAWEETADEEGRRWVYQGNARFVDRCEFRDLKQSAAPGAGPPVIPIVLPLVETTEVNGYKAQVGWSTTPDGKDIRVLVELSKAGKALDLSAGELQVGLLAEGNKPLPLKGRWPDPAKPAVAGEMPHTTVVANGRVTASYEFVFGGTVPREKLSALELTIKGQQQRLVIPSLQGAGKK